MPRRRRSRNKHNKELSTFTCCACLKKECKMHRLFLWSVCQHKYCIQCARNIMHQSLSQKNEVPKCIFTNCNQTIKNAQADSIASLHKKYPIKLSLIHYSRNRCLVPGYIRIHYESIPNDIISKILDFVNLIYFTKIACYTCEGDGKLSTNCPECRGTSIANTEWKECSTCASYRFSEVNCRKCSGSGRYIIGDCRKCKGSGSFNGIYDDFTDYYNGNKSKPRKGVCFQCRGSGKYSVKCNNCNGCGLYTKQYTVKCNKCNSSGMMSKNIKCMNCLHGKIKIDCERCNGLKEIIILDLNKLVHCQSLCIKCNNYYSNDMLEVGSSCEHLCCHKCINKRCPHSDCRALESFICTYCNQRHLQSKEASFAWSVCKHKYSIECAKAYAMMHLQQSIVPLCAGNNCGHTLNVMDFLMLLRKLLYAGHSFTGILEKQLLINSFITLRPSLSNPQRLNRLRMLCIPRPLNSSSLYMHPSFAQLNTFQSCPTLPSFQLLDKGPCYCCGSLTHTKCNVNECNLWVCFAHSYSGRIFFVLCLYHQNHNIIK